MAVSGLVFIGFVLLHMYGNLKAFAGHDAYNEYAEHLRTIGEPMLPYARAALDHPRGADRRRWSCTSTAAVTLWRRAKQARTIKYVDEEEQALDVRLAT